MNARRKTALALSLLALGALLAAAAPAAPAAAAEEETAPKPTVRFGLLSAAGSPSDARLVADIRRGVAAAKREGAACLVVEIDTQSGMAFSSADDAAQLLERAKDLRVVAYVPKRALGSGALLALACREIYVGRTASLGGAGVVQPDDGEGDSGKGVSEKILSVARAIFRAHAERNGHDKLLAVAMVDPDIELVEARLGGKRGILRRRGELLLDASGRTVSGARDLRLVVERGRVLTLFGSEAVELGLARRTVASRKELLAALGLAEARITGVDAAETPGGPRPSTEIARILKRPEPKKPFSIKPGDPVFIVPIDDGGGVGMVDPWLEKFVRESVKQAKEGGARCIIFTIDTYGGLVSSALEVADSIKDASTGASPVPTIAFIADKKAWSAGSYLALGCDRIYMVPGTSVGGAQPVVAGGQEQSKDVAEKHSAMVRGAFKALAEAKGHNVALAKAMVDNSTEVLQVEITDPEGNSWRDCVERKELRKLKQAAARRGMTVGVVRTIIEPGKLLVLTAEEAKEYGFAADIVADQKELLEQLGLAEATIVPVELPPLSGLARFWANPVTSASLLALGVLLLMVFAHSHSPTAGLVALFVWILFFFSVFAAGLASGPEILIFLVGVALLAVELFFVPGFGVFGILGLLLMVSGLLLSLLPPGIFSGGGGGSVLTSGETAGEAFVRSITTLVAAAMTGLVGILIAIRFFPHAPLLSRLVLKTNLAEAVVPLAGGATALAGRPEKGLPPVIVTGTVGTARSDLRPAGFAEFEGEQVDVVTDGMYISEGEKIRVVRIEGIRVLVARA